MKYHLKIFLLICFLAAACKKKSSSVTAIKNSDFHVLGYLYSDNNWNDELSTDLSMITDLNLAFINPDVNGSFTVHSNLSSLVSNVHAKHVKIFLSLGGAAAPAHIFSLLEDDKRVTFISNLVSVAEQY